MLVLQTAPVTIDKTEATKTPPVSNNIQTTQPDIKSTKSPVKQVHSKVHPQGKKAARKKSLTVAQLLKQRNGQTLQAKTKFTPRSSKVLSKPVGKETTSSTTHENATLVQVNIDLNGRTPSTWEPNSASSPVTSETSPTSHLDTSLDAHGEEVVSSSMTTCPDSPGSQFTDTTQPPQTGIPTDTSLPELPTTFDLPGARFVPLFNFFPNASLDRAVLYGENLNFTFPVLRGHSIFGLLAHFIVLERNPLELGIICSQDFDDPANQAVAITINDVPFKAKPVPLVQLREILYTHVPKIDSKNT